MANKVSRSRHRFDVLENLEGYSDWVQEIKYPGTGHIDHNIEAYKSQEISDWVTPNFNRRIARGEVINHPCSMEFIEVNEGVGYWETTKPGVIRFYSTGMETSRIAALVAPSLSGVDDLDRRETDELVRSAKLSALADIDSTPFAMGEDIGEIGETLRLLRNPLKEIHSLATHRIYGRRNQGWKTLRQFAKAVRSGSRKAARVWAQYQWGFRPLFQTVDNLVASIAYKDDRPRGRTFRLSAHGISSDSGSLHERPSAPYHGTYDWTEAIYFNHSIEERTRVKAAILYEVTNPIRDWRHTYGLRLKDLPTTGYQLIPLSFMLDRLVNIQAAIAGLINLSDPTISILAASVTTRRNLVETLQMDGANANPGKTVIANGGVKLVKHFTYQRATWSPTFSDLIPPATPKNLIKDITSILDLLALILR
jgi:hypothetical protein